MSEMWVTAGGLDKLGGSLNLPSSGSGRSVKTGFSKEGSQDISTQIGECEIWYEGNRKEKKVT